MASIKEAARILKRGGLVGFPTESFWALGADATNAESIKLIFSVKGREKKKPIALVAADVRQVKKFFYVSEAEEMLMKYYWPGALTILLRPKKKIAASALRAKKIGVRVPAHRDARLLAITLGRPITATSLNISGRPPTKSRKFLEKIFFGLPLTKGRCGLAVRPSTVIEVNGERLVTWREGAVVV